MATKNTTAANVNASYVINPVKGEVKFVVREKKETKKEDVQPITGFAKNTRYSIYNNGGGYTGL